jgi:lipopolysaccharide transport system ATP-binding protein
MRMTFIRVEDIWKSFRIPHQRRATIFGHIAEVLSVLERERYSYEEFWALRGVSFELEHGESLGIIGPNGSGKSTLLKLMAKIIRPDRGTILTSQSVAPVLELGIGFHGDLTAKENIMVYGVIMGLRLSEMKKRTASVLEFAGLNRFQDAKLRNLSSGMQVRLAFAIAIETQANIFLIDEALAVGDAEFQQKCLDKFHEFKKKGKSIVLVSHEMNLIKRFCEKTLYLQRGEPRVFGQSEEAITQYVDDTKKAAISPLLP